MTGERPAGAGDAAAVAAVAAVAALDEPTRRRLYDHVIRQPGPVSRDEAAEAVRVPRTTAAFHLDRLVDEGLLAITYERRTGRSGPGAGRPAKLYRRSDCEIAVSVPQRSYDLAGQLLAAALAEADAGGGSPRAVLDRRAYDRGRALGADRGAGRQAVSEALEAHGYEPRTEDGVISLVNCPFHSLAQSHPDLVCGMNLQLLHGLLDGLGETGMTPELRPTPGRCCVRLVPST